MAGLALNSLTGGKLSRSIPRIYETEKLPRDLHRFKISHLKNIYRAAWSQFKKYYVIKFYLKKYY